MGRTWTVVTGVFGALIVSAAVPVQAQPFRKISAVVVTPPNETIEVGQHRFFKADATLEDGQTRILGGNGSAPRWHVTFSPLLDVSACRPDTRYSSQGWSLHSDGTFHEVWSPGTPDTVVVDGSMTLPTAVPGATFTAEMKCFGSDTVAGTLNAIYGTTQYDGQYMFSGQSGAIVGTGLTWSSDDPSVASVAQTGEVIAHQPGTTVIRATFGSLCWSGDGLPPGGCPGQVTGTATVTVIEADPPGNGGGNGAPLDAGPDQTVECSGPRRTPVQLAGALLFEPEPDQVITKTWTWPFGMASGLTPIVPLPLGPHQLTLTISDGMQSASDTVNITVVDTTDPVIRRISATPAVLWPPNHKMTPVTIGVTASDVCDPTLRCRIVSVTSNEAIDGRGDGHAAPDWKITGPLTVWLRAERAGGGDGRAYSITVECRDSSGNRTHKTVEVVVPHDQRKR
jgi:hypothetical protein